MRLTWRVGLAIQAAALASVTPLTCLAAPEREASRLALVIGNSAYTGLAPLPTCSASAHIVTAVLRRAGYTVTERLDDSNGRMGAAFSDFTDALTAAPGGTAIVYVCSYAVGFDGRVFLLPVSATLERRTDALTQGVVAKLPVGTVTGSQVKAGLVILDTVAAPSSDAVIAFAGLIDDRAMDDTGFVAARASAAPPQGPSTLAAAFAAAFAQPTVEIKATVQALQGAFAGAAAANLTVHEPAAPAYLAGGPDPARAAPTPAPSAKASAAAAPTTGAATAAALSSGDRRRAQISLQRLGYFSGRVNGALGPDTTAAIRRYQTESRAEPTGRLTAAQFDRLLEDGR